MRITTTVTISLLIKSLALIGLTPALLAESIVVMSYNIHRGGIIHKKQPLSQTAKGIQLAKADIVGSTGNPFSQGRHLEGPCQVARVES